jgi:hypothetical protein
MAAKKQKAVLLTRRRRSLKIKNLQKSKPQLKLKFLFRKRGLLMYSLNIVLKFHRLVKIITINHLLIPQLLKW